MPVSPRTDEGAALIRRRRLNMIDHQRFHRTFGRLQLQSQLLLDWCKPPQKWITYLAKATLSRSSQRARECWQPGSLVLGWNSVYAVNY
jgi:hypothetical protein